MRPAKFSKNFLMRFGAREGSGKVILNFLRGFAGRDVFLQRGIRDVGAQG